MPVQTFNFVVTTLALVSLLLAILIVAIPGLRALVKPFASQLALAVALVATLGSLTYSEYFLFEPCRLCWYQRIAMYPLVVILVVGLSKRDPGVRHYVAPPALIGFGISVYHYLLQTFPSLSGSTSCSVGVSCTAKYVNQVVSIPFMAGCGFLLIFVLMFQLKEKS